MSALPCGSMNVIYAEQYDTAPQFATRTVALSMIFMLFYNALLVLARKPSILI